MQSDIDAIDTWLLDLPPSRRQTWLAAAVAGCTIAGLIIVLPFANTPLVQLNAFFPSLDAIVFVTDLVTAVLLFGQYAISRARSLLALATGYLFTALIVVPHALTFSGAFTPNGLLGANIQTGSWLFIFWHLGFGAGLLAYALLREKPATRSVRKSSPLFVIVAVTLGVIVVVCALTWLSTAGADLLPAIILDRTRISPIVHYPISFTILVSLAAAAALALRRRRSELDQWLIVVALVFAGELVLSGLVATVRFSLGFYVARGFSLATSSIVLIVLLAETTRLYGQLVRSNALLRREQNSKMMSLEAMAASVTHEVRQPLTAITSFGQATLEFLRQNPPKIQKATDCIADLIETTKRADEIFKNLRSLFSRSRPEMTHIDVNDLVLEILSALKPDLSSHGIETRLDLARGLPAVLGNKAQLQEVMINVVGNAIDAMESAQARTLTLSTTAGEHGAVKVEVKDSGRGLGRLPASSIFDAFVTTKPHGMGLGLALCRLIVMRHGGTIAASPSTPHGAVFQITLPTISQATTALQGRG